MINIVNKKDCVGCNACLQKCPNKCISMKIDEEGFNYPDVNLNECIDCHLCEIVCPVLHHGEARTPLESFAAYSKAPQIRTSSTSGGIFYELSKAVLDDNGLVFGVMFDERFDVITTYIDKIEDLWLFQGSKYVQSDITGCYNTVKKFLTDGKKVLFSGTPCQVNGLLNYLGRSYENLICVDFACHGVPSPLIWREYLKNIHHDTSFRNSYGDRLYKRPEILQISFRNKKDKGWLFSRFSIVTSHNSTYYSSSKHNLFLKAFLNNFILRPCCYDCKFKSLSSGSDITLCDFWGIQNLPVSSGINDIQNGVSGVFVNSDKGMQIFNKLDIYKVQSNETDIIRQNPSIIKSTKCPANRALFFLGFKNGADLIFLIKKYCNLPLKVRLRYLLIKATQKIGLFNLIKKIYD